MRRSPHACRRRRCRDRNGAPVFDSQYAVKIPARELRLVQRAKQRDPAAARQIAEQGWAREDVRRYLYEKARIPAKQLQGILDPDRIMKSMRWVLDVPPDYVSIRSSLGRHRPTSVVIAPASDGRQTRAVLELGPGTA